MPLSPDEGALRFINRPDLCHWHVAVYPLQNAVMDFNIFVMARQGQRNLGAMREGLLCAGAPAYAGGLSHIKACNQVGMARVQQDHSDRSSAQFRSQLLFCIRKEGIKINLERLDSCDHAHRVSKNKDK